jgi:hypothetical protein
MGVNATDLHGRWTHSHEEDEPGTLVFRPGGWNFPPSRGRRSFRLCPDGSLEAGGPGPDDRTRFHNGRWRLLPGDILELIEPGNESRLHIVQATKDQLVFERR